MLRLLLVYLLLQSSLALAATEFQSFTPRANSTFQLTVGPKDKPVVLSGSLAEKQVRSGQVMAAVQVYGNYATLLIALDSEEMGTLYVLKLENSIYRPLNAKPIGTPKGTMISYLDQAMTALNKDNNTETSLQTMVQFFNDYPKWTLHNFLDQIELGHVRAVAGRKATPTPVTETAPLRRQEAVTPPSNREPPLPPPTPLGRPPSTPPDSLAPPRYVEPPLRTDLPPARRRWTDQQLNEELSRRRTRNMPLDRRAVDEFFERNFSRY